MSVHGHAQFLDRTLSLLSRQIRFVYCPLSVVRLSCQTHFLDCPALACWRAFCPLSVVRVWLSNPRQFHGPSGSGWSGPLCPLSVVRVWLSSPRRFLGLSGSGGGLVRFVRCPLSVVRLSVCRDYFWTCMVANPVFRPLLTN